MGVNIIIASARFASETMPPLTNLIGWWDFSADYVTKDGSNYISQVNDRSGNSRHATQGTSGKYPLWVDAALGTRACGTGDGSNDYLQVSFSQSSPCSVFAVCKHSSSTDGDAIWSGLNDNSFRCQQRGGGAPNDLMIPGTNAIVQLTASTWGIAGFAIGTSSTRYKKNMNASALDNNGVSAALGGFTLFSRGGNLTLAAACSFTDVLLYSGQLSDAEMTTVHTALAARNPALGL